MSALRAPPQPTAILPPRPHTIAEIRVAASPVIRPERPLLTSAAEPYRRHRETYMVMPEDGRIGRLSVIFGDGREELLEGAYSAIDIDGGQYRRYVGDEAQLKSTFSEVIQSLPKEPMSTTLFFVRGKDELTAESKVEAARIHRFFVDRQSQEVWIIGHTDTVGADAYNEALSVRRAERVRTMLIYLGVPAESIVTKGMGKRAPRVPTADNTDEPRNRRVDISVR